jgi:hypothetical protein
MMNSYLKNNALLSMYVRGGELYEDEEIHGDDFYVSNSVYESNPDEYIYEDDMDLLSIAYQDKMRVSSIIIS